MILWLAADSTPHNSPGQSWLAYLALAVPLSAPFVAGLFSLRTTRKTPHEKLEKPIGVLKDWPDDLPGRETVYQSIELTLGEVRDSDKLSDIPRDRALSPEVSAAERRIDAIVTARAVRRNHRFRLLFAVISFLIGVSNWGIVELSPGGLSFFNVTGAVVTIVYLVAALVLLVNPLGFGDLVTLTVRYMFVPSSDPREMREIRRTYHAAKRGRQAVRRNRQTAKKNRTVAPEDQEAENAPLVPVEPATD